MSLPSAYSGALEAWSRKVVFRFSDKTNFQKNMIPKTLPSD